MSDTYPDYLNYAPPPVYSLAFQASVYTPVSPAISSLKSVLLATTANSLLTGSAFLLLTYYRATGFDTTLLAPCTDLDAPRATDCSMWMLSAYMGDAHWLAIQFTVYIIPATVCAWLCGLRIPVTPRRAGALSGILAGLVLLLALQPGRLPALAAVSGGLLGGLLAASQLRRRRQSQ